MLIDRGNGAGVEDARGRLGRHFNGRKFTLFRLGLNHDALWRALECVLAKGAGAGAVRRLAAQCRLGARSITLSTIHITTGNIVNGGTNSEVAISIGACPLWPRLRLPYAATRHPVRIQLLIQRRLKLSTA